jgi:GNAT superfamily N-acetyltransferase
MRAVRFEDVPEILRMVRRAVERGCRDHYDAQQRAAVYVSYARTLFVEALGPFDTVAAEEQGRIVGVAQLDATDGRLRALFVDAGFQQRGLGRTLIEEIEARARGRGCRRLHGAMALNAVPFYLRTGFRRCGGPDQLLTGGISIPVVRMEKDIGPSP